MFLNIFKNEYRRISPDYFNFNCVNGQWKLQTKDTWVHKDAKEQQLAKYTLTQNCIPVNNYEVNKVYSGVRYVSHCAVKPTMAAELFSIIPTQLRTYRNGVSHFIDNKVNELFNGQDVTIENISEKFEQALNAFKEEYGKYFDSLSLTFTELRHSYDYKRMQELKREKEFDALRFEIENTRTQVRFEAEQKRQAAKDKARCERELEYGKMLSETQKLKLTPEYLEEQKIKNTKTTEMKYSGLDNVTHMNQGAKSKDCPVKCW